MIFDHLYNDIQSFTQQYSITYTKIFDHIYLYQLNFQQMKTEVVSMSANGNLVAEGNCIIALLATYVKKVASTPYMEHRRG